MTELTQYLSRIYPAQESTNRSWEFRIDDPYQSYDAPEFSCITLRLEENPTELTLRFTSVPTSGELIEIVEELEAETVDQRLHMQVTLEVGIKQVSAIQRLAQQIRQIINQGDEHLSQNWEWLFPRAANSLDMLAINLMEFTRAKRNEQPVKIFV